MICHLMRAFVDNHVFIERIWVVTIGKKIDTET